MLLNPCCEEALGYAMGSDVRHRIQSDRRQNDAITRPIMIFFTVSCNGEQIRRAVRRTNPRDRDGLPTRQFRLFGNQYAGLEWTHAP